MIRLEDQFEGKVYQSAFNILGINSILSIKHRMLRVGRLDDINKVKHFELFKLHSKREAKFLEGLIIRNYKSRRERM